MCSYKSTLFCNNLTTIDHEINDLFKELRNNLNPMDKSAMKDRCEKETYQMENFLKEYFDFENIPGEYIVQGVKSFKLGKQIEDLDENLIIQFPSSKEFNQNSFKISIKEIKQWQKSYIVYALNDQHLSIDKEFLFRALQGQSNQGIEAFKMKFVIRISQCPILMEFDGKIISRELNEDWPNRIKLVSVTGIDFAGRIHDINDILTYIINWRDLYHMDTNNDQPIVYNGRDFSPKKGICVQLNENRLSEDLIRMVYLRLFACNQQNIEIVVETGIGLGVFAGKHIGIDDKIRSLSAKAIKYVIEQYGKLFTNIRAIIFALPIFEKDETTSTFYSFVQIFNQEYKGSIPILIIDQDMHRLTVYSAREGFSVSQLNPADSHGVFGEYWQNFGPAVEEKLALTTLGLIIQHHLFNKQNILNFDNYYFVPFNYSIQPEHSIIYLPTSDDINRTLTSQNMQPLTSINNIPFLGQFFIFMYSLWAFIRLYLPF